MNRNPMKRLYTFISFAALSALVASCSLADGKGLDVDEFGTKGSSAKMPGNGIYFDSSSPSLSALVTEQGGSFTIVPRLAHPVDEDVTLTLEVIPERIGEYNAENGLVDDNAKNALHLLPEDLYSFVDPNGKKSKKDITITIPAGQTRVPVSVVVEPLFSDKNPFKDKLALPVRIASTTSAYPILSSPAEVMLKVDRDRKVVTSVMKTFGPFVIKPNVPFKEAWSSWTFQFSEMYDNLSIGNTSPGYMGGGTISSELYTRIDKNSGIQIKNLHEKQESWTHKPLNVKEWLNISFVYEDKGTGGHMKVYLDDVEQNDLVTSKIFFALNNPDVHWAMGNGAWKTAGVKIREIRFWNKALTPEEIKEYNQLPIEDPETVKNLIMYAPMTKEDLKDGIMTVRKGDWTINMGDTKFDWLENVAFPNRELVQVKPVISLEDAGE